jgi:heme A synthase
VAYGCISLRLPRGDGARMASGLMLLALVVQVTLGITTLLYRVPVVLGASHQAGALALFTLVLIHTHSLKYTGSRTGRQPDGRRGHAVIQGAVQPL